MGIDQVETKCFPKRKEAFHTPVRGILARNCARKGAPGLVCSSQASPLQQKACIVVALTMQTLCRSQHHTELSWAACMSSAAPSTVPGRAEASPTDTHPPSSVLDPDRSARH